MGSQNRESHPGLGEDLERLVVDGGLRQPHTLGLAPESFAEIFLPPPDLRDLVAPGGQRQDHVIVGLGDRVAVAATRVSAPAVGLKDVAVGVGRVALEPGKESRSDIERDFLEVVDDV